MPGLNTYAVVDGSDGRTHHIKLPDLEATGDSAPGSIVELRKFDDARGQRRAVLAVRSDLGVNEQVGALGATWLDRQAIAREPVAVAEGGFGAEVREALNRRAEQWIEDQLGAPTVDSRPTLASTHCGRRAMLSVQEPRRKCRFLVQSTH